MLWATWGRLRNRLLEQFGIADLSRFWEGKNESALKKKSSELENGMMADCHR
jgi:hypothetical protein